MSATIHIAYAISRRNGTSYRAKAYVWDRGVKHSFATGLGDSANEAMADAVRYIEEMHQRDGIPAPKTITWHGLRSGLVVDAMAF